MDPRHLTQVGPYTIRRYIAEGGMAWVFEVGDPNFHERSLALKVLKPDAGQGSELALFVDEANRLARINHPNVVQVFDSGSDPETGLYYYTMNMIEGPSLWELVKREGALSSEQTCEIFLGVLAGLEQVHNQNVVHRDITPRNIMVVPPDNRAIVMDLGIARESSDSEATQYTQVIRGTPLYMSPEQSAGRRATKTSDIFSLGLSFYYALKGQTVYDETAAVDSSNSHSVREYLGHLKYANQQFEMKLPRKTPKAIQEIVRKACHLNPAQRYPDAGAMREALRQAVSTGGGNGVPDWLKAAAAVAAIGAGIFFAAPPTIEFVQDFLAKQGDGDEGGTVQVTDIDESPETPDASVGDELAGEPPSTPTGASSKLEESAKEVRATALVAAHEARGVTVDAGEYDQLMKEVRKDLEKADASFAKGEFGLAKEDYIQGERKAREALHVGRAKEALDKAKFLRDRADLLVAEGLVEDTTRTAPLIARARKKYRNQQFTEATELANEAIKDLEAILPANVAPRLVARDPKDAQVVVAGPAKKKPDLTFSVKVEDLDEDPLQYAWTVDGKAREEKEGELVLSKVGADAAVAVSVSDGKGGQLEESWQVEYNEKPSLSISPKSKTVSLKFGGKQRFTAKASDPDGDPLTTEIFLDGKKVKSGSGEVAYEFEASASGTHVLAIKTRDAHGAELEATRTIKVAEKAPNKRPQLSIEPPRGTTLSLAPGGTQRFTARASDPEGGEITTEIFLDGKKVKSGGAGATSWDFVAPRAGTYELEFVVTDEHGATRSGTRRLTVQEQVAVRPPPPPVTPPPTRVKPPPTKAPVAPPPSSTGSSGDREQLVATLRDYERAFESCNSGKLRRVWRMSPGQLNAYKSICAEGNPAVLAVPEGNWQVSGDAGWLCMQYEVTIQAGGSTIPLQRRGMYKGSFVRRPDGWQVTSISLGCSG